MKFRKLAAGLLSALVLTAALPQTMTAGAETEFIGETADGVFRYALLPEGGISVFCQDTGIESAAVPEIIDGYKVTALAEACFAGNSVLTEVTLPEGLTEIGDDAFNSCESLTEITIPETTAVIGDSAFGGCSALTEVTIPASVTEIGAYAFDTTENITAFTVAAENTAYSSADGVLFDKNGEVLIKYPEARPDTAYAVPQTCKAIENWAFIGAQYLEQVDLGQVTAIGEDAFYYCVSLKSVTIPEGVTELVGAAFCYCIALENVTLPSTLESIGENCFYSCTSLQNIVLPEGLKKIGSYAFFHCTALQTLYVPKSVETVMSYCMGYCYSEEAQGTVVQEGLTLYVTKGTPGYTYATSNEIAWEPANDNTLYYVLIGVAVVVITVLIGCIAVVAKKRKNQGK